MELRPAIVESFHYNSYIIGDKVKKSEKNAAESSSIQIDNISFDYNCLFLIMPYGTLKTLNIYMYLLLKVTEKIIHYANFCHL